MLSHELIRYFDESRIDALLLHRDLDALDAFLLGPGIDARDRSGHTVLMRAAAEFNLLVLAHLLSGGADPSLVDDRARTALHHAAIVGNDAAAELLVDAGAPVDATDQELRTPLWHAASQHLPDSAIVDVLLRAGADPRKRDIHGVCPEDMI
ncbi:Ankyrin repeat protein [Corynebacterium occultum]|uniref:Ankyrin repeat protein n=1 Tax=Corynebacterium occultum TaxID=2675219 RepID=A0A6B8VQ66_9CORY|nr:ankyrin repeat domain-containing protein [Corynebacterium occultum]QGU07722.1 Ankyrin repeat protein [Corynebacterium occultum]